MKKYQFLYSATLSKSFGIYTQDQGPLKAEEI